MNAIMLSAATSSLKDSLCKIADEMTAIRETCFLLG